MRPLFHFARASRSMLVSHGCRSSHARNARSLQSAARFARPLHAISSESPETGAICSKCTEYAGRTGDFRSFRTVLARFCSTRTVLPDFACNNPAKRVSEPPFPVRPAISLQVEQPEEGRRALKDGAWQSCGFAGRRMFSLKETASCTQEGRVSGLYLLARSSWRRTPFALTNGRDCAISLFTWR